MNWDTDDYEENPYDWRDDDWGDEPRYVKEEPDCYACNDNGCRSCEPTRFDVWRWEMRYRLRSLRDRLLRRKPADDELPF